MLTPRVTGIKASSTSNGYKKPFNLHYGNNTVVFKTLRVEKYNQKTRENTIVYAIDYQIPITQLRAFNTSSRVENQFY